MNGKKNRLRVRDIAELAAREHDYLAHDFLEWFAREQLELRDVRSWTGKECGMR